MNVDLINKQIADVVLWNQVAQNMQEDFSEKKINAQIGYTVEEAKETARAVLADDDQEILDGVADVFVTLSYLFRVINKETLSFHPLDLDHGSPIEGYDLRSGIGACAMMVIGAINAIKNPATSNDDKESLLHSAVANLCEMLTDVENHYKKCPSEVIASILESNWSKYIPVGSLTQEELQAECKWIEDKYSVTDVAPVVSGEYIVFRDNNGDGKIRKPSTFKEPVSLVA